MRHTHRPRPPRSTSPLSVGLSTRSLSLPFLHLSLSATLRIRAPCRLPARYPSLPLAFFLHPFLPSSSSRSHYFTRPFFLSLSPSCASFSVPSFLIPPSSSCVYSFHRCFRPLILLVSRSFPSPPYFFPLFSFSRSFTFLLRFFLTYLFLLPSLLFSTHLTPLRSPRSLARSLARWGRLFFILF